MFEIIVFWQSGVRTLYTKIKANLINNPFRAPINSCFFVSYEIIRLCIAWIFESAWFFLVVYFDIKSCRLAYCSSEWLSIRHLTIEKSVHYTAYYYSMYVLNNGWLVIKERCPTCKSPVNEKSSDAFNFSVYDLVRKAKYAYNDSIGETIKTHMSFFPLSW